MSHGVPDPSQGDLSADPALGYEQALRYAKDLRQLFQLDRARAAEVAHRTEAEKRVRGALERDALSVVFQPIVDLATGEIKGLEALARFNALPARPPNVWFDEAHQVGLGTVLELHALERAIGAIGAVDRDTVYLAVNLAPSTLLSEDAAHALARMPPERLVVEITEHAPVEDYEALRVALAGFRHEGGRLAVDDAGAGFASLRHILMLDPDIIKLDVSITSGIDFDSKRRSLARALISFASETTISMVAEGIETESELDALRTLGVECGQGYLFARPGPVPERWSVALPGAAE